MAQQIVVVGGGVIGSSVGYFLSQRANVNVKIIESVHPACSASGKAGGFLAQDWCDGNAVGPLARKSFDLHEQLAETFATQHKIDYGYRPVTTHSVAVRKGAKSSAPASRRPSAELPPWIDTANVSQSALIGTEFNTAQVHPKLFTEALISQIKAAGGSLVLGSAIGIQLEENNNSVKKVSSVTIKMKDTGEEQTVQGDAFVFALGAWNSTLRSMLLPHDEQQQTFSKSVPDISGLKVHSIIIADPENKTTADALFLAYRGPSGKSLEPEVYPRPDGTVYCCGVSSEENPPASADLIKTEPSAIATLKEVVGSVSADLAKNELLAEQACFLPCTDDGLPVIGKFPGIDNMYLSTGHSCWGILNAPATGLALSELILDGEAKSVDLKAFDPARFSSSRVR